MLLLGGGLHEVRIMIPLTPSGSKPRPTWLVSDSLDMLSSMTVVVQVTSLEGQAVDDKVVGESDMLAAFVGEECVGVAEYKTRLFFYLFSGRGRGLR